MGKNVKKLPSCCSDCLFFNSSIYGRCEINGIWFGVEDGVWLSDQRPGWCPLDEKGDTKDSKNVNISKAF